MKITAQEEYGLRCLLQLAKSSTGEPVSVREVAEKEGLSNAYVEKLLHLLAQSGLVHSVRGSHGGYMLNRPAEQIKLGEIVRALGEVLTTEHICSAFTGNQDVCIHFKDCGLRSIWAGLTTYIQGYLEQTTLASLLGDEYVVSQRLGEQKGK